jgi:hypothetical protein
MTTGQCASRFNDEKENDLEIRKWSYWITVECYHQIRAFASSSIVVLARYRKESKLRAEKVTTPYSRYSNTLRAFFLYVVGPGAYTSADSAYRIVTDIANA